MYAEIWTYREELRPNVKHLKGYKVEATDGSIGKVDEATDEIGGSAIVVDTGPWIFGRKVVIPAGTIERIDMESETLHVGMTKDQIKNAPEYDEERSWREDEYRNRLGDYYGSTYRRAG
ncbi:MAG TPA: PRC-barrel domain containing protein [Actinomycetota bacterium]